MSHSQKIIHVLNNTINENNCSILAHRSKFIQRSTSKIKGHEFIKALVIASEGLATDSLKGLCDRLEDFNQNATLSSQALCERINSIGAVQFMRDVLAHFMSNFCDIEKDPQLQEVLGKFNEVYLQDSTSMWLHEKANTNPKCKKVKKRQIKIDVIYDLMRSRLVDAEKYEGNRPDQSFALRIIPFLQEGDLVIRDLGYFVLKSLKSIIEKGAYFLSRWMPNVKIYLNETDKNPVDLGKYLSEHKNYRNAGLIELNIFLGNEKIPSRLIMYRNPKEVQEKRRRDANKRAKETGRTISQSKKFCMDFSIFVTNVPETILTAELIGTIYRLRWTVELVFKRWKSQLKLHYLKGTNPNRIECLIWSRLCSVIIIEIINGYVKREVENMCGYEISEVRLINYLLRKSSFSRAIEENKLGAYLEKMIKDGPRKLLKEKRKRKTMCGRVNERESYYGGQANENQKAA